MLDFEKVDKMVENCKKLYPDIPDYCLWVLACDYYLKEGKEDGSGAGRRGPLWLPLQARTWRVIHSNTAPLGLPPGREPCQGTD